MNTTHDVGLAAYLIMNRVRLVALTRKHFFGRWYEYAFDTEIDELARAYNAGEARVDPRLHAQIVTRLKKALLADTRGQTLDYDALNAPNAPNAPNTLRSRSAVHSRPRRQSQGENAKRSGERA